MPVKRWIEIGADEALVRDLSRRENISRLAATVLVQIGCVEPDDIELFRNPRLKALPQPEIMLGVPEAARLIADAVEQGVSICVYGDYDVDGVTATSLLLELFKSIGRPARHFIPDRAKHGYGFKADVVSQLADEGVGFIITVDTGISGHEACRTAKERGVRVVVTDHHEIGDGLPPADAVVNPHQGACGFRSEGLTGVGIAFFLAGALRAELHDRRIAGRDRVDLRSMLDLVALGTVADMGPVTGVNRILISSGLALLSAEERPGVKALKKVAGLAGKAMNYGNVAFGLAPRINAAGRLASAETALELLTTTDQARADELAAGLDQENKKRREVELAIHAQARRMVVENRHLDRLRTLVLAGPDWHPGVIGIVASRIVEEFYRPTILISMDGEMGKGSGRSIRNFNLHDAVAACAQHVVEFGGHHQAVGLSIRREQIASFMEAFEMWARSALRPEDMRPSQSINAWCELSELDELAVAQIESLAPFGIGNPQPVFAARAAKVIYKSLVKEEHLKLRLAVGSRAMTAMGWRMADRFRQVEIGDCIDIAFTAGINEFRGNREVQITLVDF